MPLIKQSKNPPITLRLNRDLTRAIKRGHPWVFADSLRALPQAPPGTHAKLLDKSGRRQIACGYYDASSPLAFRACNVVDNQPLDDNWANQQLQQAMALRLMLFNQSTSGYRLIHGEGDGLPGLVCDVYGDTAVIRLDGEAASHFWDANGIAELVADQRSLRSVYQRLRVRGRADGRPLIGERPSAPIPFLENDVQFTADVVRGQKTGFFLDQRENRALIRRVATGKRCLNVFGYTGGFSVYAGLGGADYVETVDIAQPALDAADAHWQLNDLPPDQHKTVAADAFEFLEKSATQKQFWDLVILDPPSFAPNKKAVPKATAAYRNLIAAGAAIVESGGLLAAASCSSHIDLSAFISICEEGIGKARRRATVLTINEQPPDHPSPLVLSEFRYLKFVLMRVV